MTYYQGIVSLSLLNQLLCTLLCSLHKGKKKMGSIQATPQKIRSSAFSSIIFTIHNKFYMTIRISIQYLNILQMEIFTSLHLPSLQDLSMEKQMKKTSSSFLDSKGITMLNPKFWFRFLKMPDRHAKPSNPRLVYNLPYFK